MSRTLPPLDLHAHIEPGIGVRRLEQLGAVVFAATRSSMEFERTIARTDRVTIWGLGCHPGVARAQEEFIVERFAKLMRRTPFLGEVGLDGAARTDTETQTRIFRSILALAAQTPRIISVHSNRATSQVLDLVEESRVRGVVLHWWLGTAEQTRRATGLGCLFSVNRSMDIARLSAAGVPLSALLPETDHPAGNRRNSGPRQPGWTLDVESAVAAQYALSVDAVRQQCWSNLAALVDQLGLVGMFPPPVEAMLAVAFASQSPREGGNG